MAKRVTEKQKEEIVKFFISGKTIDELSKEFTFTKSTIVRNLKKNIGEKKYEELINNKKLDINYLNSKEKITSIDNKDNLNKKLNNENPVEELTLLTPFIELAPINYDIENIPQKELSSVHISEIDFPEICFMIIDKKVELEIKLLKDYPEWQFLPIDDLNRKSIEIHFDLKIAKRSCNKDQKVIKVPNTNVFRIAAPRLMAKGISRIISAENLIAL